MKNDRAQLATSAGVVEVVSEPTYIFDSADNTRRYPHAIPLGEAHRYTAHGVLLNDEPLAVFGDYRCSGVHEHSALTVGESILLAVGGQVVCFSPQPFQVHWQLEVDDATCFGLHFAADHDALISHGELSISRFSRDGRLLWQAYGADIFSEGITLTPDAIEAVDFNGMRYRFNYETGEPLI